MKHSKEVRNLGIILNSDHSFDNKVCCQSRYTYMEIWTGAEVLKYFIGSQFKKLILNFMN